MLFNSIEFIIFFPLVTLLYFLVPHKFRWIHLLAASCIFYAAFIPSYLLILFALIIIDFSTGILIEKKTSKKKWLVLSILANIGLLGVFKYYNFFITNVNSLTGSQFILLHLALPIGLSFHTFQSLSYTIEVYRGKQKAIRHFGYYALYVMFYPQLVAGPIERPYNLFPQLYERHYFSSQNLYEGLRLMAWGFFKKVVIADRVSGYADAVFKHPHDMNAGNIWLGVFLFSIQIYADFSGYTDIAIGAARCMGFNLMTNFNRPYFSDNIRDFWKRWHISLSSWFRDYVYIPLGGNRKGEFRKVINILLTFALSGLWHGAAWGFLLWGLLNGLYIVFYDFISRHLKKIKLTKSLSTLITFLCISFAWIFFRANSVHAALEVIKQGTTMKNSSIETIATMNTTSFQYGNFSMLFISIFICFMFSVERFSNPLLTNFNRNKLADISFLSITMLIIIFCGVFHKTSFIYYQF